MALDFKGDVVAALASSVTLPRMVRVKQLFDHSHFEPEEIPALLEAGDRRLTGPTMPPQGLYMNRVWYDGAVGELMGS